MNEQVWYGTLEAVEAEIGTVTIDCDDRFVLVHLIDGEICSVETWKSEKPMVATVKEYRDGGVTEFYRLD